MNAYPGESRIIGFDTVLMDDYGGDYGGYGGYDPGIDTTISGWDTTGEDDDTSTSPLGGGPSANGTLVNPTEPYYVSGSPFAPLPDEHASGSKGGGGGSSGSGAAMAQLAEQIREFNIEDKAQQASAQQAAGGIESLVNQYNTAYAQAVASYTQTYNQQLGLIGDVGGQQSADIRSQYAAQNASQMQTLQRLGMGNTTLGANSALGNQRSQSAALNTLATQLNAQELGVIQNKKTNQQLAPSDDILKAAIAQGQSSSGNYGGELTKAIGGLTF